MRPNVAEIIYLTWTDDGLLRHMGLRSDNPGKANVAGIVERTRKEGSRLIGMGDGAVHPFTRCIEGSTSVHLYISTLSLASDRQLARAEAIHAKEPPDVRFRIDANCAENRASAT
jgi:hypothetical protein